MASKIEQDYNYNYSIDIEIVTICSVLKYCGMIVRRAT